MWNLADFLPDSFFGRQRHVGAGVGIKQLGKARVFRKVLKVGIIARLKAQRRIHSDRPRQVLQESSTCPVRQSSAASP